MSVASLQLMFANGSASTVIRPGKDPRAVTAAMAVMVAEAETPFRHVIHFKMADGSHVTAKPRELS